MPSYRLLHGYPIKDMRARDGDRNIMFDKSNLMIPFIIPPFVNAVIVVEEGERKNLSI